jgi:hypothetical protein
MPVSTRSTDLEAPSPQDMDKPIEPDAREPTPVLAIVTSPPSRAASRCSACGLAASLSVRKFGKMHPQCWLCSPSRLYVNARGEITGREGGEGCTCSLRFGIRFTFDLGGRLAKIGEGRRSKGRGLVTGGLFCGWLWVGILVSMRLCTLGYGHNCDVRPSRLLLLLLESLSLSIERGLSPFSLLCQWRYLIN